MSLEANQKKADSSATKLMEAVMGKTILIDGEMKIGVKDSYEWVSLYYEEIGEGTGEGWVRAVKGKNYTSGGTILGNYYYSDGGIRTGKGFSWSVSDADLRKSIKYHLCISD